MLETIRAYAAAELERTIPPEPAPPAGVGDRPRERRRRAAVLDARDEPGSTASSPSSGTSGRPSTSRGPPDDVTGELRLVSSMRHFWRVRGHGIEARRRLEEVLPRISEVEPALGARVQHETAVMRLVAGDFDGARDAVALGARDVRAARGTSSRSGRVHAELGALENAAGDPQEAIGYSETAAEMLEDEEFIRLIVLGNLAESYEQIGDLERARATAVSRARAAARPSAIATASRT